MLGAVRRDPAALCRVASWLFATLALTTWAHGVAHAQYEPPAYAAPSQSDSASEPIDYALIAFRAGQPALALDIARNALRDSPENPRLRLVEAALRNQLDPAIVLGLDDVAQGVSLAEFDAIGQQRVDGHIVGVTSAVVGVIGTLIATYLPVLIDAGCFSPACEQNRLSMRFIGGTIGIAGLVGGGVAIGLQVDAGNRWGRWADGLRIDVTPGSLALRF